MKITYFGHSHFLVEGKDYSITLDPFSNIGLKEFETRSDYLFCSHGHYDHSNFKLCTGAKPVYGIKEFETLKVFHDEKGGSLRGENEVLIFWLDGFKLAFLGDIGENNNEMLIEKLKGVDVLFVPVGGTYTITDKGAYEYAIKSGAKTVIPMHYHVLNSTVDIEGVAPFLQRFESFKVEKSPLKYCGQKGVIRLLSMQGEKL
ncbi:MAG: MBL fold metallo-hydrolase [Clostridia bacterium]|nr:MBL fold metallo-hydrolase [Clostridia bacterium]